MLEHAIIRDLNHIRVFAKVAELRSVTGAAKALGMPKSTVSREVARLEAGIGTALLQRSGRGISLTDMGTLLCQRAAQILGEVKDTEIALSQARAEPRGLLRVCAPYTSGHSLLMPLLPKFLERYPEVQVVLDLDNRQLDPPPVEADVVVRVGRLEDSSLSSRKLARVDYNLFASPSYLARRGTPRVLGDLAHHEIVDKGGLPGSRRWDVEGRDGRSRTNVSPRLIVNDPATVRLAILAGAGIGWLPTFLADEDIRAGRLALVLPGYRRDAMDIHVLYPSRKSLSPKVRVFVDYLIASLDRTQPHKLKDTTAEESAPSPRPAQRTPSGAARRSKGKTTGAR